MTERSLLATYPTQTIRLGGEKKEGYYRASRGGYCSSGGDWDEVNGEL